MNNILCEYNIKGAATTVRCVSMSDEELKEGGQYYVDCNSHNDKLRADLRPSNTPSGQSMDSLLWTLSEELIVAKGFSLNLEEESKQNDSADAKQSEADQDQEKQLVILNDETTTTSSVPQIPSEQQNNETTTNTGTDANPSDAQN
ncbi:hypothetical protein RFI_09648 [Reticulomyxa filosa]|uniref:Uncharacterized protein n=1 Tax=Reticulomyxa filosa TaxID=46433 RepID=X6NP75_RETFI|nr:hypothetical protein RFI_09648 [Reticulomyxa filosa]|eukprot:ETO27484.1 hypothetical protein RFI_09648 [Reticulomyxa filosa]